MDYYPPQVFLAPLDVSFRARGMFGDQNYFFGSSITEPDAILHQKPSQLLSPTNAYLQPAMLCFQHNDIEQVFTTGKKTWEFMYGFIPRDKKLDEILDEYRKPIDFLQVSMNQWKSQMANISFAENSLPFLSDLQRELSWRSYLTQANSAYWEYYGQHVISQGSAYLYLHGADGVPRDQSLFTLA